MRYFILLFFGIIFASCREQNDVSNKKSVEETLLNGEWRLISSQKPFKRFQSGLKFSEDGQVFNIDSQGQIIPPHHERMYKVYGDTLTFIDHKYLENVRFEKGTDILVIEKLTDKEMVLKVIHPGESNELTYKNMD